MLVEQPQASPGSANYNGVCRRAPAKPGLLKNSKAITRESRLEQQMVKLLVTGIRCRAQSVLFSGLSVLCFVPLRYWYLGVEHPV